MSLMCVLNFRSLDPTVQPAECKHNNTRTLPKILPLPLTREVKLEALDLREFCVVLFRQICVRFHQVMVLYLTYRKTPYKGPPPIKAPPPEIGLPKRSFPTFQAITSLIIVRFSFCKKLLKGGNAFYNTILNVSAQGAFIGGFTVYQSNVGSFCKARMGFWGAWPIDYKIQAVVGLYLRFLSPPC